MAKILITGVAGFIGSHTAEFLIAAGHEVIGVDNFRSGHRKNMTSLEREAGFSFYEADISIDGNLASLVRVSEPSAIIHLAGLVSVQESVSRPDLNFRYNILTTHLVAEAARLGDVTRIVFASSAAVYGDGAQVPLCENSEKRPISPYGAAKLASETLLMGHGEAFGITVRSNRYFNVYGPRQNPSSSYSGVITRFMQSLSEGKSVTIFGDGLQTRDFVSVFDVARANAIAATKPRILSGAANICTGNAISIRRLAEILQRHFPSAPSAAHLPARNGDIRNSVGNFLEAANTLDFIAERSLEIGLAEFAAGELSKDSQ